MKSHKCSDTKKHHAPESPTTCIWRLGRWRHWFLGNTLLTGILAVCWLVLRSGTKPSRLAYPCQQAAVSTVTLTLGLPLGAALITARCRLLGWIRTPAVIAVALVAVLIAAGVWSYFPVKGEYGGPLLDPPAGYRAKVYHLTGCPHTPTRDRYIGLDNLITLMGRQGLKFYESAAESLVTGPDGIIGTDDVVVIKINYQWSERGGTNVDLLSGLIRRIVDHPDTFNGEVVVCENAQFAAVANFDRPENNAKDHGRSPHDVVVDFQGLGHNVSHYDWTAVRGVSVDEYSAGDATDGYIVYDHDPQVNGRVSYPKFRTDSGTYISLKYGIWDPVSETYDREHLKFINVPVLKSHGAVYGATVCVKNYMGLVTDLLSTNSHNGIATGILGALLGEIGLADLNIIDAMWINANPSGGPSTSYIQATRRKELVASLDPVAADIWAVKNILIPAFIDRGYSPPWPSPSADPDDSTGEFREYLDNSMYQILAAGDSVTNDLSQIDAFTGNGAAGDFDADNDVDSTDYGQFEACFTGEGGGPVGPECAAGDFDGDGDIDCDDWDSFKFVWNALGDVPQLPQGAGIDLPGSAGGEITTLVDASPNPMNQTTRIEFAVGAPGTVRLRIFDMSGRAVRSLVDDSKGVGKYSALWDGRNDAGKPVASGVYFYRLDAPGLMQTKKIVISR